jgi:Spy/CpxP family protein refolding chaperone
MRVKFKTNSRNHIDVSGLDLWWGAMKSKIPIFIFCFFFILATSPAFSQTSEMKSGSRMGMKRWRGESPCWKIHELNLSLEQRKGLDLIQQTYFRDTQVLRVELFTKLLELRELLINPSIKIESLREKYLEISELRSKQEEKVIEYLIKMRNLLTPEQLQHWCPEQEFPSFLQMMYGTGPMGSMHPKRPFHPVE